MGHKTVKALVDSGVSVFRQLGLHRNLQPVDLFISQIDRSQMRIEGMTWLPFKLAGTIGKLKVYVAPDLCGNLILGSDWLRLNKAQICFDPTRLVLEGVDVPLGSEVKSSSPDWDEAPLRKAVSSEGRINIVEKLTEGLYQITLTERYEDGKEEVTLCSSVVEGREMVPLLLVNTANKTITIKEGEELGCTCPLKITKQMRVSKDYERKMETSSPEIKEEDLIVSERCKDEIRKLLKANWDVIANTDKEVGQTGTVQMKIDTGDHPPIRLRPYRTPIHKRKLFEETVNEILGNIERSRPP